MRKHLVSILSLCLAVAAISLHFNKSVVNAINTQSVQIVSALPSTCNTGELYNLTTATAGQNLYLCTAANTLTAVSSGSTQPVQNGVIQFCSSTTGNDSYACNFTPAFTSYAVGACTTADVGKVCDGTIVQVLVDTANTGAATFAPNGLAAKNIRKQTNKALKNSDIEAGTVLTLAYQRTLDIWQMQSQVANIVTTPGPMVLLEEHTATTSASLDFTTCISSTYTSYHFSILNIKPSTTAYYLKMKVSTDGGMSWLAGTGYYWRQSRLYSGGLASSAQTADSIFQIGFSQSSTTTFPGHSGTIELFDPMTDFNWTHLGTGYDTVAYITFVGTGSHTSVGINAVQFLVQSNVGAAGNIAQGTIKCYGVSQ